MKTILYQPIFINPQAYFVFPQLYHIEKGDSYIEPANITGQIIINDLTKSLTSTPILNVVQDTNQVDFSLAYNITKDDNMTPNSTSLIGMIGTSIRDISFYRKNSNEYLQYPAVIVSHKIEVKNCKFAGYNYCIGLTPVYIDSLLFESITQYDCKNFLVCCNYKGNVIQDRTL